MLIVLDGCTFCCDQHKISWKEHEEDFVPSVVKREHKIKTNVDGLVLGHMGVIEGQGFMPC